MIPPLRSVWKASMSAKRGIKGFFLILSCVYSLLTGLRVGFSTAAIKQIILKVGLLSRK